MKNLISKLFLTVLTVTIVIAQTSAVKAEGLNVALALNELITHPCINEIGTVDKPGKDEGYLITIIEEPLYLTESTEKTSNKDEFEARKCFRNNFSYLLTDKKKLSTSSELSTICSTQFEELYQNNKDNDYKALFSCQPVQVILCKGGTCLINHYISMIYRFGATTGGIVAVLVLVINAVIIAMAGGDSGGIDEAKKRIIQSLAGLAVLFLSALILYTINPTFFIR